MRWRGGWGLQSDDKAFDAAAIGLMEGDGVHELFIHLLKEFAPTNAADVAFIANLVGLDATEAARAVREHQHTVFHHKYLRDKPAFTASVYAVVQWLDQTRTERQERAVPSRALRPAQEEGLARLLHRASLRWDGHKKIPDRDTQAWESKAQSLWSLQKQKEILDKSPFLKRCHGRKPPCTVIGCDGRHGTRTTGTGGSGGGGGGAGSSGRGATQAPDARRLRRARQGPNHPARSWTWDQLKAWLRAQTNKEPRHKSQEAALAAVLKKWDPAQHDNQPAPLVPTSTGDSDDEDEAGDDVAADPPLSDAEDDDADVFFDA